MKVDVGRHRAIEETMPAILAIPAGLIIGSFATVVAYRVPRHQPFVGGRSACPDCGTTIAAYDNIPVVSWLILRGRCRSCGARISARYPLTELGTAILFAATVLILGTDDPGELALGLMLCALLIVVTLTDLERRVIPNAVLLVGAVAGVAIAAATDPGEPCGARPRGSGRRWALLLRRARLSTRHGDGGREARRRDRPLPRPGRDPGDADRIRRGGPIRPLADGSARAGARKRAVPFGPFLALGGIVGLWYGDAIVGWYVDTFVHG